MKLAIIGGSGMSKLKHFNITSREVVRTTLGEPSAPLVYGELFGKAIVFLSRHGSNHRLPPHQINYRANISALKQSGVTHIIGITTVGGITHPPETLLVPDQLIDYTWGREHSFYTAEQGVRHIDFSSPFCEDIRNSLISAAKNAEIDLITKATYGVTQGPRLETSAEINRMQNDGCDLVGMTAMPEAALAKELGLCYGILNLVVNWAAGKSDEPTINQNTIDKHMNSGMKKIYQIIKAL